MKSQRQLQIGENIKRVMSEIFMREGLSSLNGSLVTILEADVSPDVKNVKIFIDIFGNESFHDQIIRKLNEMATNLRYKLAKQITFRTVPEIMFVLDKSQSRAYKIESLIAKEAEFFNQDFSIKLQKKSPKTQGKAPKKASTKVPRKASSNNKK